MEVLLMKIKQKKFKQALAGILAILLLLSLAPWSAFGQTETGQITIKDLDAQGALVSGATVAVKSVERGTQQTFTTNDEGIAVVTNLQPGLYEIIVQGSGFAPNTQRAQITAGAKLSIEATLSVTVTGEVVNVVAGEGGVEVNTQTQELSNE